MIRERRSMAEGTGIEAITPYARSLGITLDRWEDGVPVLTLDFTDIAEGRPGALHGGVIAGLLETAGYAALSAALTAAGRTAQMKPINIAVQYLATGKPKRSFAHARIARLGRRNANIAVEAWQDDRARLIASAVMNVMMKDLPPT